MDREGGKRQRMRKSWEWISLTISSFSLHFLFISSFSNRFLFILSFSFFGTTTTWNYPIQLDYQQKYFRIWGICSIHIFSAPCFCLRHSLWNALYIFNSWKSTPDLICNWISFNTLISLPVTISHKSREENGAYSPHRCDSTVSLLAWPLVSLVVVVVFVPRLSIRVYSATI